MAQVTYELLHISCMPFRCLKKLQVHIITDAVEPRRAPDGAADRGRVRAAAVGAGDGGGAEPGPGGALPVAVRHRRLRCAQLPLQRRQLHGPDGRRHEQALHARGLRQTSKY